MSRYPSKILLFGEYAIIHKSMALAIPYQGFYGEWKKSPKIYETQDFAEYLDDLEIEGLLFDYALYQLDQKDGLHFSSNIPQGFGIGSSGALTTAFYIRYIIRDREFSIAKMQSIFSKMESFFHGSSSGIDPLISYTKNGIIVNPESKPTLLDCSKKKKFVFYLINSHKHRVTAPLVKLYKEKYKSDFFQKDIEDLKLLNAQAIEAYQNNDEALFDIFQNISQLQENRFSEMIIPEMKEKYRNLGLKLCGAGGGGFYLGVIKRVDIPSLVKEYDIILIE